MKAHPPTLAGKGKADGRKIIGLSLWGQEKNRNIGLLR